MFSHIFITQFSHIFIFNDSLVRVKCALYLLVPYVEHVVIVLVYLQHLYVWIHDECEVAILVCILHSRLIWILTQLAPCKYIRIIIFFR